MSIDFDLVSPQDLRRLLTQQVEANGELVEATESVNSFITSANLFMAELKRLTEDPEVPFAEKLDGILSLNVNLIPIVLYEMVPGKVANDSRISVARTLMSMIKGLETSIYKKREVEQREEVDLTHPKFQKAMDWIMEAVLESMTQVGVSDIVKSSFIHDFARRMMSFEAEANKKLKGVSFSSLDTVSNPLVRDFNEERKA